MKKPAPTQRWNTEQALLHRCFFPHPRPEPFDRDGLLPARPLLQWAAMLARRQSLLWTFAGGCLSGAALIGWWHGDVATVPPEASLASTAELPGQPSRAHSVNDGTGDARVEPSPPRADAVDVADDPQAEPGSSSVADVLARLEAAYREGLAAAKAPAAAAPVIAAPAVEVPAREAAPGAVAAAAALPSIPAQPATPTALAPAPTTPAALAPAPATPAAAPQAEKLLAAAPPPGAQPALAARGETQPRDAHVASVEQSRSAASVQQGDVYQLQQLAVLQYMQLLALSSYGGLATPGYRSRGVAVRAPAFKSSLTNPDNPWGFDFPPAVLVK